MRHLPLSFLPLWSSTERVPKFALGQFTSKDAADKRWSNACRVLPISDRYLSALDLCAPKRVLLPQLQFIFYAPTCRIKIKCSAANASLRVPKSRGSLDKEMPRLIFKPKTMAVAPTLWSTDTGSARIKLLSILVIQCRTQNPLLRSTRVSGQFSLVKKDRPNSWAAIVCVNIQHRYLTIFATDRMYCMRHRLIVISFICRRLQCNLCGQKHQIFVLY